MRRGPAAGLAAAVLAVSCGVAVTSASAFGDDGGGVLVAGTSASSRSATVITPEAPGPVVLVSGRDDHGELASAHVSVHAVPGSAPASGEIRDGTLARVVALEGTWLEVRTLEGPAVQGWVDDFYLRREIHLVGPTPSCRSNLAGHALDAGEQAVVLDVRGRQVRVQLLSGAPAGPTTGWVSRAAVHELAPREGCGESAASGGAAGGRHQ